MPDHPERAVARAADRWWAHPAVGVALVLAALLAGALGLGLWHLRQDTLQTQSQLLASLASSTADELQRSVQGVMLALRATRDDVDTEHAETVLRLRRRAALLPMVRALWVLGADGRVLASSAAHPPPPMAEYLPAPHGLDDETVAFSQPFADPIGGDAVVALAMRWRMPNGAEGWVLGTMPAAAMLGAFPRAVLSPDMRLAALRADGSVLAGTLRQHAGVAGEPDARPGPPSAWAASVAFDDGTARLVQRRRVEPLGLTVVLTRDTKAVLARWRDTRQLVGWGLLAIVATLVLLLGRLLRAEAQSRQLQRRLARVRTLESLGTLAGGVAHDFNNILAAVLGYGEMAREGAAAGSALGRQLDQIIAAALRGKAVVERILAFSRGRSRPATVFALQPVVEQTLSLLAATLPAGVRLAREFEAPDAQVRGDSAALFEALMNLCTNARQAMPTRGVLTVALRERRLTEPRELSHGSVGPGRHALLEVGDTGVGMASATLERLFEPFFTTRGHKGTGLGLAMVHGVVQDLGGAIDVRSRPGAGSRFGLWLPWAEGAASSDAVGEDGGDAPAESTSDELPRGQGQVVLVVDDEPALVALAEESLAGLGYEPVGFGSAEQALAEVQAEPARFDLVISDEVMPGMNGTALAERLRALRPELPVLLMSGFGGAQLQQRAHAAGVRQVLAKPLQRDALARAIAGALNGTPKAADWSRDI